jgi:hypothetical protein
MPLDFRPFTIPMMASYCFLLETFWSLYKETDGFILPYQRAAIWSLLLQTLVTCLLIVVDFKRNR